MTTLIASLLQGVGINPQYNSAIVGKSMGSEEKDGGHLSCHPSALQESPCTRVKATSWRWSVMLSRSFSRKYKTS